MNEHSLSAILNHAHSASKSNFLGSEKHISFWALTSCCGRLENQYSTTIGNLHFQAKVTDSRLSHVYSTRLWDRV